MRFLISLLAVAAHGWAAPRLTYQVIGGPAGSWSAVFSTIGLRGAPEDQADVLVLRSGAAALPKYGEAVERGTILVVEGKGPASEMFGFRPAKGAVQVRNVLESRRPDLAVIWEQAIEVPRFELPKGAILFSRERWTGTPLVAGYRRGKGAVLWVAADPGTRGYERFPYLPHALNDLGFSPPFRSRSLWAFFDSSYRLRADLEYLAKRWRAAGVSGLHVAAWHFYERDPERDAYLERLIRVCHENAIVVYAWLELPHVSEKFWNDHPEWREKTADLADAYLDWRKLMNLLDPDCRVAVKAGVSDLILRFDWDGVNLAELYFESLEGAANPSRFTPMNAIVREEFRKTGGVDPVDVFRPGRDEAALRKFLDYRAGLARRMQEEWLRDLDDLRHVKPDLDLVLTHVDDHLDGKMRDAIGADAAAVFPALKNLRATFMIEDPATVWHLGPERYDALAERYAAITGDVSRLALDINVVERYQNVYPTKQQTGLELLQLIRASSSRFPRTALYFENSILPMDWLWLPVASAQVDRARVEDDAVLVEASRPVLLEWSGPATVNGKPWPLGGDGFVVLPKGTHRVTAGSGAARPVSDFNGEVIASEGDEVRVRIDYHSESRAIAVLRTPPTRVEVSGVTGLVRKEGSERVVLLPSGRRTVTFEFSREVVRGW